MQRGHGSEERPVAAVLWRKDSHSEDPALTATGNLEPDNRQVNYQRYYDPDWAQQEFEKLFSKTWLYACREEDMPEVGDRVPFDVGPLSFIIIRSDINQFKAFFNACLHRGTALCTKAGSGDSIRCLYHGWEWNGVRAADLNYHHTNLGRYQEMIIQHWNTLIDKYLAAP